MPSFTCIFPCQHRGALVRKGQTFTVTDDELKLPANAALLSPFSFTRSDLPPVQTPPATDSERAALLERCAALKLTPRKKATIAELKALIAEAADPAGNPAQ